MMFVRRPGFRSLALTGLSLVLVLSSCQNPPAPYETVDTTVSPAASARLTLPPGFLQNGYDPLEAWLDKRFDVEYRNMTPERIFDEVPIAEIKYDVRGIPDDLPLFHLKASSLSRREILFKIAEFWELDMRVENGPDGKPSIVVVTPR